MEKNINTIKNENEMTEERKTIRERVKEILESINEKAKKYYAGDDSTLRYMKHYRFLQKDMSREVTTKEFEEWLEDTMKKYNCKDSDSKAYAKSELMKDLDFEYYSMKRRAEEKKEEEVVLDEEELDEEETEVEDEDLDESDTDAINNYMTEMAYDDFLNDLDNEDYETVGDLWDWWLDNFDLGGEAVYDGEYTQADVDAEGSLYGLAEYAYANNKDFIDFDKDKAIADLTAKGLIRKVA